MAPESVNRSDHARPRWLKALEGSLLAEVSSRSLGLLRIFTAITIYVTYASPWCAHRMDDFTGTWLLSWGVLLSSWFVVFGFKTRPAAAFMALCLAGLQLYYGIELGVKVVIDTVTPLQISVLLALTPCGRSLSVDRALEVRRAKKEGRAPPPERVPWWLLELFVLQTATVYFWLGYDGLEPEWLDGTTLELHLVYWYGTADAFVAHPNFHRMCVTLAWTATILEFVICVGLILRQTRPYVMWVAFLYLFVHMVAFSRTWIGGQVFLLQMTMLIACLSPKLVHALVANQVPAAPKT